MSDSILDALLTHPASAIALDDGERHLGYAELHERILAERRWLANAGVDRCALLAANGAPWIVADLALMDGGYVHVPLPESFTVEQRQHALDDAGIRFVLTDQPDAFERAHPEFTAVSRSPRTQLVLMERYVAFLPSLPAHVIKVTYTSGSTATPKGVCLRANAMTSVARSLADATSRLLPMRHLCLLPLATLLENIAGVYVPLLLGAQIVTRPAAMLGMSYGGLNARRLLQTIDEVAPQSLVLVPELLRLLVSACDSGWRAPSTLKFIAVGGATVAPQLLLQAHRLGLPVYEGYGLSECASVVCLNTPEANRPGSVGRPLPHAHVRIDANGEIWIGGATMAGYLGDRRQSPHEIRSGDLGTMDADGFVYVRGRAKNLFITSMGRNVAPEWVERELTCEPAVAQAMVIGEARAYPVAMIAAAGNATSDSIDKAVAKANTRLPDYARVRRWIAFPEPPSPANSLMTANGRLRRDAILDRYATLVAALYSAEENLADVVL